MAVAASSRLGYCVSTTAFVESNRFSAPFPASSSCSTSSSSFTGVRGLGFHAPVSGASGVSPRLEAQLLSPCALAVSSRCSCVCGACGGPSLCYSSSNLNDTRPLPNSRSLFLGQALHSRHVQAGWTLPRRRGQQGGAVASADGLQETATAAVTAAAAGLTPVMAAAWMLDLLPGFLNHTADSAVGMMAAAAETMPLARVGLPCTVMECGDVVYRSTLPKQTGLQITPGGVALVAVLMTYLVATPGVAQCLFDFVVAIPLEKLLRRTGRYDKTDFELQRKPLGSGAFGKVFMARPVNRAVREFSREGEVQQAVIKVATEFGFEERWMNERVRRSCPSACATFVDGFYENPQNSSGPIWLVWKFEGSMTLADALNQKDFPYFLEEKLLGSTLDDFPKGPERAAITIRELMLQLLSSMAALHKTGIVHRDVKPQNVILADVPGSRLRLKLIDLGAAADLRTGINYVPQEFILDPRFAAPEQYIMDEQTPSAPPLAIAALLSPVLWQLNQPNRFDSYSAGVTFLQMVFPNLRSDNNLIAFNRQLANCDYDLNVWREKVERKMGMGGDLRLGFEIMNLDTGAGWELATSLVRRKARSRVSADRALLLPFFAENDLLAAVERALDLRPVVEDEPAWSQWLLSSMTGRLDDNDAKLTENDVAKIRDTWQPLEQVRRKLRATIANARRTVNRGTGRWFPALLDAFNRKPKQQKS